MTKDDDATRALNKIAAILQLAHSDVIDKARASVLGDDTNKAILAGATSWASSADLQKAATKAGASRATFFRRVSELVERGFLERREAGGNAEYRSTGLI
jgi:Fic family protein